MSAHSIPTKLRKTTVVSMLMLALAASAFAQTPGEENVPDSTTTGLISGRVVSESGAPIPNASVLLRSVSATPATSLRRAQTDREGAFRIEGLEKGLYWVTASAPAYAQPIREPNAPPIYYRVGDSVTLTLIKGGVITGTITTAAGEPVVGVNVRTVMVRDATGSVPKSIVQFGERLTDDRGVYRIYGLPAGVYLVSAGGRGNYGYSTNAFENDAPTYVPSATRDTAEEVEVSAGSETSGVDIRYRGEPGRSISGTVTRLPTQVQFSNNNLNLRRVRSGVAEFAGFTFTGLGSPGFTFYGVSDGEYELEAQATVSPTEIAVSDPFRVTVKGADVSGIVLTPKLLATIAGRVVLEASPSPQCQNKRRPAFEEIMVIAQRNQDLDPKRKELTPLATGFSLNQSAPDKAGEFLLRNVKPGRYNLSPTFFARYWFFRGIAVHPPSATKTAQPADLSRTGLNLKSGETLKNLILTLAEGAGSVRGNVTLGEGQPAPSGLTVFLTPAEREAADNPLRYHVAKTGNEGSFLLSNLAPGNYWVIARIIAPDDTLNARNIRDSSQHDKRLQLRRDAEAAKFSVELKPCQNLVDFQLPLSRP